MDDHFRDGFEQLLSDMDEAPSWKQVLTQSVALSPAPPQRRGLLVAAAAFVVTIIAVGAVILASGGASSPVAADTVDYVKLAWSQDVELRCVDMEIVDNGGFDRATIEIWGPNADGLIRVDATAPDGTVERIIVDPAPFGSFPNRVWSNFTILDTDDQIRLLKQVMAAADIDEKRWPARRLLSVIDRWKDRGLTPDKIGPADASEFANARAAEQIGRAHV